MTMFDIKTLHAPTHDDEPGAVIEVDFYHAGSFLAQDDEAIGGPQPRSHAATQPRSYAATQPRSHTASHHHHRPQSPHPPHSPVAAAKERLDIMLPASRFASVVDAAVVRLPAGVNW